MSYKRAMAAGAKQKEIRRVQRANAREDDKPCTLCGGLGHHKRHGKWYCKSCWQEMGG